MGFAFTGVSLPVRLYRKRRYYTTLAAPTATANIRLPRPPSLRARFLFNALAETAQPLKELPHQTNQIQRCFDDLQQEKRAAFFVFTLCKLYVKFIITVNVCSHRVWVILWIAHRPINTRTIFTTKTNMAAFLHRLAAVCFSMRGNSGFRLFPFFNCRVVSFSRFRHA